MASVIKLSDEAVETIRDGILRASAALHAAEKPFLALQLRPNESVLTRDALESLERRVAVVDRMIALRHEEQDEKLTPVLEDLKGRIEKARTA